LFSPFSQGKMSTISFGFVEFEEPFRLVSHLFPDKVGGRPAWLALTGLPQNTQCAQCQLPMAFLLQLYSPLDERKDCFHRTLFVFMCKNGSCFLPSNRHNPPPFRVYRSQLPRNNRFYSSNPPSDLDNLTEKGMVDTLRSCRAPTAGVLVNLCPICGCPGTKCCILCKKAYYCSKEHQTIHWKQSHKTKCPQFDYLNEMFLSNSFLLPEFLLSSTTLDKDPEDNTSMGDDFEESDFEPNADDDGEELKALEEVARKETREELFFNRFKEVLKKEPDQVIRFERGGTPLWASPNPITPPNCLKCGGKRTFEFQITPQLLLHLKLDRVGEASPDFASVYVFTCENSCPLGPSDKGDENSLPNYVEEFVAFDTVP
uniref:MYND-type domain-containing protein n=1 Tax=Rodentolepis nana TaxID=102285 RepID=A0A0R3TXF3_RODNA